jgi:hypothetical protein
MTLAVMEGPFDGTYLTFLGSMLVNLIAIASGRIAKVVSESFVGFDDTKISILNSEVARHSLEILFIKKRGRLHHHLLGMVNWGGYPRLAGTPDISSF